MICILCAYFNSPLPLSQLLAQKSVVKGAEMSCVHFLAFTRPQYFDGGDGLYGNSSWG